MICLMESDCLVNYMPLAFRTFCCMGPVLAFDVFCGDLLWGPAGRSPAALGYDATHKRSQPPRIRGSSCLLPSTFVHFLIQSTVLAQ